MDRRYKFARSENPFEGLEDYANAPPLDLKIKKFSYPIQMSAFGDNYTSQGFTQILGHFFERLSQAKHGGQVRKPLDLEDGNGHCKPDLTLYGGRLVEVKAVKQGESIRVCIGKWHDILSWSSKIIYKNPKRHLISIDIKQKILRKNLGKEV